VTLLLFAAIRVNVWVGLNHQISLLESFFFNVFLFLYLYRRTLQQSGVTLKPTKEGPRRRPGFGRLLIQINASVCPAMFNTVISSLSAEARATANWSPLQVAAETQVGLADFWGRQMVKRRAKKRGWNKEDIRILKALARKKTAAANIARTLKRTEAAIRRKACSLGLSLETRLGSLTKKTVGDLYVGTPVGGDTYNARQADHT
jgi:hypothetical protein